MIKCIKKLLLWQRIFLENKYARYDLDIPVEIKSDHTIEDIENGKCDKDIHNEIYKDTGEAK